MGVGEYKLSSAARKRKKQTTITSQVLQLKQRAMSDQKNSKSNYSVGVEHTNKPQSTTIRGTASNATPSGTYTGSVSSTFGKAGKSNQVSASYSHQISPNSSVRVEAYRSGNKSVPFRGKPTGGAQATFCFKF